MVLEHRIVGTKLNYYWVIGQDADKKVVMGPYGNYEQGDMDGYANFQNYEVVALPTRDRGAAREMIRKKILDETHSVETAFRRFRHIKKIDNEE